MNRKRPPSSSRLQCLAQRDPRRYRVAIGIVNGIFCGVFFGLSMALLTPFTFRNTGGFTPEILPLSVISGVVFGVIMGVFFAATATSTPLPPGTDRARKREVGRLLRAGAPGPDPVANRLARIRAEALLRVPYLPRTAIFLLSVGLASNAWALGNSSGPVPWIHVFGVLSFLLLLCLLLPHLAEERGRARAFLIASEDAPGVPRDVP
ncbi:hypothetical protein [Nocardiopsis sp. ATB16-24]|uniref:hypothetical protein n=1 Tax=Nocardiopsis sp. ATB16-24 TaxID=3019555 RepID=UPI002555962A|nr:hypothetical protein [Nocardiopsis sp. ATB16-24]